MLCPTCHRNMTALFLTQQCDHCDFGPDVWKLHRGFVIYAEPDCTVPACARCLPMCHVFRAVADAVTWQGISKLRGEVRAVLSPRPFKWAYGKGPASGIVLAGSMFVVHPDHRYPDAVGEVFLAPTNKPPM